MTNEIVLCPLTWNIHVHMHPTQKHKFHTVNAFFLCMVWCIQKKFPEGTQLEILKQV